MRSVNQNLRHVEKVENDLVRKENKIEKDIKDKDSKEKKEKDEKEKQEKLNHNSESTVHSGPPTSFFDAINRIRNKIGDLHSHMQHKFMGGSDILSSSSDNTGSPIDDGEPHIIKVHMAGPFGFGFGNPFSSFSDGPDSALGEPMQPHFLGLNEDPFGP